MSISVNEAKAILNTPHTRRITEEEREQVLALLQRMNEQNNAAIDLIVQYGGTDGAHHKDWVLDQVVRKLAGDNYEQVVKGACAGEDGPNTYTWDCGIAP
jgi:molybdopterin biosynthesis enzyme MoaB